MNKRVLFYFLMILSQVAWSQRDPTQPPGVSRYQSSGSQQKQTTLQGLIYGENSWVIINDIVIKEGGSKKGIKVLKIKKNKVLIKKNGVERWLTWHQIKVKKYPKKSSDQ